MHGTTSTVRRPIPVTVFIATMRSLSLRRMSSSSGSARAPSRSTLLMKRSMGSRAARTAPTRRRVWACTPSTAEMTSTTLSSTASERSTSATKSACPGVSMRWTLSWFSGNETTADLMVIPRARSSSIVSVWVVPRSTLPTDGMMPVLKRIRSVRLVLPASTCARIPIVIIATQHTLVEEASDSWTLQRLPHWDAPLGLCACGEVEWDAASRDSSTPKEEATAHGIRRNMTRDWLMRGNNTPVIPA